MTVEQKIKLYLNDNNIQQKELSEATGISRAKINLSLNSKRRLKFDEYEKICGALNVQADAFLEPKVGG